MLYITRSGYQILILKDASALTNAEASPSENQFSLRNFEKNFKNQKKYLTFNYIFSIIMIVIVN
jgi:hypothetical protein